jgi:hypothetical protein
MDRVDFEIRDQKHLMDAEGCQDDKPSAREIVAALKTEGFRPRNLDIFYDRMQGLWRWHCGLLRE